MSAEHINPLTSEHAPLYLPAMNIDIAAVPLNRGWIFYNCTITVWQQQAVLAIVLDS
jgi:hypothetical protein